LKKLKTGKSLERVLMIYGKKLDGKSELIENGSLR
jgi:hypothetical protein